MNTTRRDFIKTSLAAAAAAPLASFPTAAADAQKKIKLGIDNFAVRAMGWKAPQLLKYAAELRTDSILISDLEAFEKHSDDYLSDIRKQAADLGLQIHLGTWSICPTSKSFRPTYGTAEELLKHGIRMAKTLGSPVLRVVLGSGDDRKTEGGIWPHIKKTVEVCKSAKSVAQDAGVKIAVENHAGDMQAMELVALIEEAGKDFVGANMDSGNATWTMEDPLQSLELLGPYALTTSLRDSAIWESPNGVTIQWTAMGEGNIDLKTYFRRYAEICPHVPVHIETISGFNRELPIYSPDFWKNWPNMTGADLARFLAIARRGKPREPFKAPANKDRKLAEQEYQKGEVERSIRYCKEELGLGIKTV